MVSYTLSILMVKPSAEHGIYFPHADQALINLYLLQTGNRASASLLYEEGPAKKFQEIQSCTKQDGHQFHLLGISRELNQAGCPNFGRDINNLYTAQQQ